MDLPTRTHEWKEEGILPKGWMFMCKDGQEWREARLPPLGWMLEEAGSI